MADGNALERGQTLIDVWIESTSAKPYQAPSLTAAAHGVRVALAARSAGPTRTPSVHRRLTANDADSHGARALKPLQVAAHIT